MRILIASASALLACVAAPAMAQSEKETLAAKFGALEDVAQASLSPDGKKVAYISGMAGGTAVFVADVVAGGVPKRILVLASDKGRLTNCAWTSVSRIVCQVYFMADMGTYLQDATRLFAVDADGQNLKSVSAPLDRNARGVYANGGRIIDYDVTDKPGSVLMTRQILPNDRTGSHMGSAKAGLAVESVDTVANQRSIVEQPREDAFLYRTDGRGTVRILGLSRSDMVGNMRSTQTYLYRKPGSREWERLSVTSTDGTGEGFFPILVDADKNVVYGFDNDGPYKSLYSVALDGSLAKTKVLGRDGYDIDGVITIGRQQRVVGASYATEHRIAEYFDVELKKLTSDLHNALPGAPSIDIAGASEDEKKLLVIASGDTAPGMYYLYDKGTRQLAELLPIRPQLDGVKLAAMKPISFKAADGTMIPGYLTLPAGSTGKNLPAIVMPHGGPSARDEWGFDWLVQYFAARGFAVIQPNYRGSDGYGSGFYQKNGFQGWRTAIGDVTDAGRWMVAEGIAAQDKLAIFGWSYGGYAALQSSVVAPSLFKAIVAVAPVTDLEKLKSDRRDFSDSAYVNKMIGTGPHVRDGSPAQNAGMITAPVLMFSGDRDLNVNIGQSRHMKSRLESAGKPVTFVEFPGLDHYLLDPVARTKVLSDSDAFIRKALALPPN